jgi:dTDP-4-amino-4,6-dideoxygalactose transaminase
MVGLKMINFMEVDLPTDILSEIEKVLSSNRVTNNGPNLRLFEEKLESYFNAHVAVVDHGQTALTLMLRAYGLDKYTGNIITPSYTFSGTAHAISLTGLEPNFCDIESITNPTISISDIEKKINKNTRAILACDTYSIPCDYIEINNIAKRFNIPFLVDSASSFGTFISHFNLVEKCDAQIYSFHATKPFSTIEGGAVVSCNEDSINLIRDLRNFGIRKDLKSDCIFPGINGKMQEINALIGLKQLERFPVLQEKRTNLISCYDKYFSKIEGIKIFTPYNIRWSPAFYPIYIDTSIFPLTRNELFEKLAEKGIECGKYFELPCHKMWAYEDHYECYLPNTEKLAKNVLCLPLHKNITEKHIKKIIDGFIN